MTHIALTILKVAVVISPFFGIAYAIGGFARLTIG